MPPVARAGFTGPQHLDPALGSSEELISVQPFDSFQPMVAALPKMDRFPMCASD